VGHGDDAEFGAHKVRVYDTPGHTRGHICFHLANDGVAFMGDTLFALGCGRLFEGTAEQVWNSLSKLLTWPAETKVACAHGYTQANARFALTLDPENTALCERATRIDQLHAHSIPTVPTTMGLERKTNPFLRPDSIELQRAIGMDRASIIDVFAKVRALKDQF
jgi:hydroxyacylglutathione hydrolase